MTRPWRIGRRSNHDYTKRRVLGLTPWKPKAPKQPLVKAIDGVLAEYRDFWPLTARQVYYRLIGLGVPVAKTKVGADGIGDLPVSFDPRPFIERTPWRTARTVTQFPHAYYVEPQGDACDFDDFWRFVR